MRTQSFEDIDVPRRRRPVRRYMWLRTAVALSLLWAVSLCGVAIYEYVTIDPWTFVGESRGPIFFGWSEQVVVTESSFGDVVLAFDASRFWTALLAPIILLIAFCLAISEAIRRVRRRPRTR